MRDPSCCFHVGGRRATWGFEPLGKVSRHYVVDVKNPFIGPWISPILTDPPRRNNERILVLLRSSLFCHLHFRPAMAAKPGGSYALENDGFPRLFFAFYFGLARSLSLSPYLCIFLVLLSYYYLSTSLPLSPFLSLPFSVFLSLSLSRLFLLSLRMQAPQLNPSSPCSPQGPSFGPCLYSSPRGFDTTSRAGRAGHRSAGEVQAPGSARLPHRLLRPCRCGRGHLGRGRGGRCRWVQVRGLKGQKLTDENPGLGGFGWADCVLSVLVRLVGFACMFHRETTSCWFVLFRSVGL